MCYNFYIHKYVAIFYRRTPHPPPPQKKSLYIPTHDDIIYCFFSSSDCITSNKEHKILEENKLKIT